jgi:hypothetical protein
MTEQFAFQKIERNGRAIQLDKSAPAALTCIVNGVSNELFSRAGFPFNEDSRVRGRNLLHLVENRFEGSAIADDPLERTLGLIRSRVRDCYKISHRNPHATAIPEIAHISSAARALLSNS